MDIDMMRARTLAIVARSHLWRVFPSKEFEHYEFNFDKNNRFPALRHKDNSRRNFQIYVFFQPLDDKYMIPRLFDRQWNLFVHAAGLDFFRKYPQWVKFLLKAEEMEDALISRMPDIVTLGYYQGLLRIRLFLFLSFY